MSQSPSEYPFPDPYPKSLQRPILGASVLRILAAIGTLGAVLWRASQLAHLEPRQGYALGLVLILPLAVACMLLVVLPSATWKLVRNLDLLVPFGLWVTADAILALIGGAFAWLTVTSRPIGILGITFTLSWMLVVNLLLGTIYAGWTAVLVCQAADQEEIDPLGALTGIGRWFGRTLLAVTIGWGGFFLIMSVALLTAAASILLALPCILGFSLVWNLGTAPLLLVLISDRQSLARALGEAMRLGISSLGRWWPLVILQMALLGAATYCYVSYTDARGGHQTKSNWQVNGFWTGGFEDNTRWHGDLAKALDTKPLPLATLLLGLPFAVLAIAIKLQIATDLAARRGTTEEPPSGYGSPAYGRESCP